MRIQKIGNEIEQLQFSMDGIVEKLARIEAQLHSLQSFRKNLNEHKIYVDEQTALIIGDDADVEYVNRKMVENEMPKMSGKDKS